MFIANKLKGYFLKLVNPIRDLWVVAFTHQLPDLRLSTIFSVNPHHFIAGRTFCAQVVVLEKFWPALFLCVHIKKAVRVQQTRFQDWSHIHTLQIITDIRICEECLDQRVSTSASRRLLRIFTERWSTWFPILVFFITGQLLTVILRISWAHLCGFLFISDRVDKILHF